MPREWHFVVQGQQQGPVDGAELRRLWVMGQLPSETPCWKKGMPDWRPFKEIEPTLGDPVVPGQLPGSAKRPSERIPVPPPPSAKRAGGGTQAPVPRPSAPLPPVPPPAAQAPRPSAPVPAPAEPSAPADAPPEAARKVAVPQGGFRSAPPAPPPAAAGRPVPLVNAKRSPQTLLVVAAAFVVLLAVGWLALKLRTPEPASGAAPAHAGGAHPYMLPASFEGDGLGPLTIFPVRKSQNERLPDRVMDAIAPLNAKLDDPGLNNEERRDRLLDTARAWAGLGFPEIALPYVDRARHYGADLVSDLRVIYAVGLARLGRWNESEPHLAKIAELYPDSLDHTVAHLGCQAERMLQKLELDRALEPTVAAFLELCAYAPADLSYDAWSKTGGVLHAALLETLRSGAEVPALDKLWPYFTAAQAQALVEAWKQGSPPAALLEAADPANAASAPAAALILRSLCAREDAAHADPQLSMTLARFAADRARKDKDPKLLLHALWNLADAARFAGNLEALGGTGLETVKLAEARKNPHLLASAHHRLGQLYASLGNLPEALRRHRQAFDHAAANQLTLLEYRSARDLIVVAGQLGVEDARIEEGLREEAERLDRLQVGAAEIGTAWYHLGLCLSRKGRQADAIPILEKALAGAAHPDTPLAWLEVGRCQLELGQPGKAEAAYRKAGEAAAQTKSQEFAWKWRVGVAKSAYKQMKPEAARKGLYEALDLIESQRASLRDYHSRLSTGDNKYEAYELAVSLAVAQGDEEAAFLWAERARARSLLDSLGQNAQAAATPFASVKELQALCGDDLAFAVYFLREHDILAWTVTKDKFQRRSLPFKQAELREKIVALRLAILADSRQLEQLPEHLREEAKRQGDWKSIAQELHRRLWGPLEGGLGNAKRVCIVPHQALHYLPFQALNDGSGFLVQHYEPFYAPSASVYAARKRLTFEPADSLIAFDALISLDPNSPFYRSETGQIARSFPKARFFLERDATAAKFREAAPEAGILHVSSHGSFDPLVPSQSGIHLFARIDHDGRVPAEEIYEYKLPHTGLVVLSACVSSIGGEGSGDEVVGVTRAFQHAGVPNVIGTLWEVENDATTDLMKIFYEKLKDRPRDPVGALCAAQRAFVKDDRTPAHWAAFQLNGIGTLEK
ncbi:MAG: CHAT domain-containing protein [Planctomycetes bacterium]|nr:CHAT domain-containing protein [Planctomycetota bacterium]